MFGDLQVKLRTKVIGKKILHAKEVDSTNDEAKKLALVDPSEGTVVIADSQKKGRGRLGRKWISEKGKGICLSIVIRPYINPTKLPLITYFSSVAVVRSIRGLTGLEAKIKWPNDIMIAGKKAGGILTEVINTPKFGKAVIVGMGINVNNSISSFPQSIKRGVTSLKFELGSGVDIRKFVALLIGELDKLYQSFLHRRFSDITGEWMANSQTMGEWVTVKTETGEIEGMAESLGREGELNIRIAGGKIRKVYSGDVVSVTEGYLRRRYSER